MALNDLARRPGSASALRNLAATPGVTAGRFCAWMVALTLLAPVLFILSSLFGDGGGESWSHVRQYLVGPAVRATLILMVGTAVLAALLGVPAAWCVSRYDFPGRRIFSILLVLPLAIPPYLAAYASTDAREAAIPVLIAIRENYGVEAYLRAEVIHRYAWLILMMAAVLAPYVFLSCRAVLAGQGRKLGEAARLLGSSPWRTFRTIHLPLLRPALVAGLFLVTMEVLSDYGAAKHLGINTLTVTIFRTWFGLDELKTATYLSGWVLTGVFVLLLLERWQRGRARFEDTPSDQPLVRPRLRGTLACLVACALPVVLGLLFPVLTFLDWQGTATSAVSISALGPETRHTLTIGLIATATCLAIALLLLATARFSQKRSDSALSATVFTAGYACPGTVMAVGVLGVAAGLRQLFPEGSWLSPLLLSGSLLWLAFALTARYLTVAGQVLGAGFTAIPIGFDEAARTLGRRVSAIFATIHLPLLRAPALGALVLVFVDVSKELPLTLLLRPFDFETLGTTAFSSVNEGRILECAGPALLLIALNCAGLLLVELLGWTRTRLRGKATV